MFVTNQSDRNYAVLPANLMRLFSEIYGYGELNKQIYEILSEDGTFRVNELMNQSENLKRRINKERLDGDELNLMFKCYNVKPIEGSSNQIRSLIDDKDEPIDLIEESKCLLNKKQHVRLRSIKLNSEYVDLKFRNLNQQSSIEQSDLPEELIKYFNFIINNLFSSSNNELYERICKDLSSNDQLNELAFYLINYFNQNLINISKDRNNLIKMIFVIESLIKNRNLEFKLQTSFIRLIDLSLNCLLNDKLDFDLDFLFKFKFFSAKLLRSILIKFHLIINQNQNQILIKLMDLLLNQFIESNQLDIKYGIMIFYQILNPFIFFEILFPHLMQFTETLEIKLTNETIKANEKKLFDLILMSLVSCFNCVIDSDRILESNEFDINEYYLRIYNVYSDSFINQIRSNDSKFIKIAKKNL